MNGVKIAVPVSKMSRDDLEYVEEMTGISLQDEKPLGDSRKSRQERASPDGGAKVEKDSKPEYDWFQFFLDCNVAVGLCERYAQVFHKDSMDESVLPDVDANILRTLGLREGDIIKVMRTLDAKYGRTRPKDNDGGLFSGPGGALRNNTRKGRPAPAVQASDVVDASAFSSKKDKPSSGDEEASSPVTATSPPPSAAAGPKSTVASGGFDDDAWDVKPSRQPTVPAKSQTPPPAAKPASPIPAALTGSMKDLSLLSEPLQPTKAASPPQLPPQATGATTTSPPRAAAAQPMPGATPGFFSSVAQQNSAAAARQRPAPPQQTSPLQGSLVPPPPQRPLSAPQSAQPSAYPAPGLTPQMTGLVQGQVAPPGQSLNDMTQQRLQQQYTAMQPQYTGFPGQQAQGMHQPQGIMQYQQSGNQGQFMHPMMTGMPQQSPFADPGRSNSVPMQPQQTGYQPPFTGQQTGFGQPPQGGINNYLPQPLEPQRTSVQPMQPQPTGFGQAPQQQTPQPLQPQQTGPAPPVRFGVEPKKLAPQATGRKANLSQASEYKDIVCSVLSLISHLYQLPKIPLASRHLGSDQRARRAGVVHDARPFYFATQL